jgi:ABC-2 type transport system permease protein
MPSKQLSTGLGLATRLNTPWSPLNWAGRSLVDIGEERWSSGLLFLALALGLAGVVFYFSLVTAERLYYNGWASMQGVPRKKRAARTIAESLAPSSIAGAHSPFSGLARTLLPNPVRAVISKDFLVLRRDLRNMSQVVTPLIFGIIYGIMLIRNGGVVPQGRGEAPVLFMGVMKNVLVYANIGLSLFVGWSMLSRLALMGFSHEGKSYWLLKTAPINNGQLLAAKFLVAYVPSIILGWIFLLVISLIQHAAVSVVIFGMAVVALCMAGTAGINLAFGVKGARLDWDDPRHMQRGTTGCLSALVTMGFLPLSLVLFFSPPVIIPLLGVPMQIGQLIGLAIGGAFSLGSMFIPLLIVRKDVEKIGEL